MLNLKASSFFPLLPLLPPAFATLPHHLFFFRLQLLICPIGLTLRKCYQTIAPLAFREVNAQLMCLLFIGKYNFAWPGPMKRTLIQQQSIRTYEKQVGLI
jgi:hypothetical protein